MLIFTKEPKHDSWEVSTEDNANNNITDTRHERYVVNMISMNTAILPSLNDNYNEQKQ